MIRFWRRKGEVSELKKELPPYTNSEICARIDDLLHDAMDRDIMRAKLVDGLTLNQIALSRNIPESTVRDHYYKCLKILFNS